MTVTHEQILALLVTKDAELIHLTAELAATLRQLAEARRDATAARMEADNLLALQQGDAPAVRETTGGGRSRRRETASGPTGSGGGVHLLDQTIDAAGRVAGNTAPGGRP